MKIIVCVKQVIDPEEPPGSFGVDESGENVTLPKGVPSVISPFDRQAVEAALRIKDEHGAEVIALSMGAELDRNVVRDPLSLGADELVLLEDESFASADSSTTAYALSLAIRKIGNYDLILCGRQASDSDAGLVGAGIAAMLGIPCVTIAKSIEAQNGLWKVERVTDDGTEVIAAPIPALVTVSNELGEPRYPTIKQVMAAKRQKPVVWNPADIGAEIDPIGVKGRRVKQVKLFKPIKEGRCEFIKGDSPQTAGANLAQRLREADLL
jgi:electron transfer flavoprotein beta subunit